MPDFTSFANRRVAPRSQHPEDPKQLINVHVDVRSEKQALGTIGIQPKTSDVPDKLFSFPQQTQTPKSNKSAIPSRNLHRRNASDPCTLTLPPDYENESLEDLLATLCVRHEKFGDAHPKVGQSYNRIGTYHYRRGDFDSAATSYDEALKCYQLAYANNIKYKNKDYYGTRGALTVATILGNIGTVLWRTGRLHEATAYLEESLQIQEALFGRGDKKLVDGIDIARTLYNLGICLCLRGSHRRALQTLTRSRMAFASASTAHGPLQLEISRVVDAIGKAYLLQGDAESAMRHHLEALEMKKSLLDARHPTVLCSWTNVAEVHRMIGEFDRALSLYRQVLGAQKLALLRAPSNGSSRKAIDADIAVTLNAMAETMKERKHNETRA